VWLDYEEIRLDKIILENNLEKQQWDCWEKEKESPEGENILYT